MIAAAFKRAGARYPNGYWRGARRRQGCTAACWHATPKGRLMRYVFGDYILDPQRQELWRAGTRLVLRPKVFQLLLYLLEQRDRLVSKHELIEQLWPHQFISEATLLSCIKAVRQAVGDAGRTQLVIETRHRQGYRFVAAVALEDTSVPMPERSNDSIPSAPAALSPGTPVPETHVLRPAPVPLHEPGVPTLGETLSAFSCPGCQQPQLSTVTFCAQCSTRLVQMCAGCGQAVRLPATFCPACGQALATAQAPAPARTVDPLAPLPSALASPGSTSWSPCSRVP
jgi:DNA-binding winged helix-turn-helix (wHTH) protein